MHPSTHAPLPCTPRRFKSARPALAFVSRPYPPHRSTLPLTPLAFAAFTLPPLSTFVRLAFATFTQPPLFTYIRLPFAHLYLPPQLRLIETEFTYKMLKAVHLRVQGRLIHWEMAKCAMERPPALPPSPHPPPSPQPMLPSPLSPPPPDFTLEYSTLAVTGSGLLGLVAWWLRRQLGGCSPAALREAFDRGRARRGATGLATSDDADNVDDLIIETTDAENVDDLVYKSRAEQHAHRPGRKTYSNEVTDVQVSDGVLD